MAGFNVKDADNYGGQGGGGFLSLKRDKEIAKVRILYEGIDDVQGYSVHEVDIDGKKRYVNCLREYGDPVDACPCCRAGLYAQVKYFVPIYNLDSGTLQTWERGKKFGTKLTSICSRYPNVVSHTFEIERNGAPGSKETTYEVYETGVTPDVTLDQFEVPNALGTIILDKDAEAMETYLRTGSFGDNAPVRRDVSSPRQDGGYARRTPSNAGSEDDAPRRRIL